MARTIAVLLLLFGVLALVAACNDESDFLLDEGEPEATGTPAFEQRTPQPSPEPSPEGSPVAADATPVTPFEVNVAGVNRRSEPSTEASVVATPVAGDTATVVAEVAGEEVDAGNDIWYQLDDGTFVYSGAVKEAAEGEETPEATETAEAEQ